MTNFWLAIFSFRVGIRRCVFPFLLLRITMSFVWRFVMQSESTRRQIVRPSLLPPSRCEIDEIEWCSKRRGKRTSEPATTTEDAVAGGGSSKKKLKKSEVELSEYEKEVHKLTKGCLREERISGMRPLTK